MSTLPKCTLVAPTYNWPEALNLLLKSLKEQTYLPGEVIIADDGSSIETRELIEKHQSNFPIPIVHIWQEDKGNRKPRIMNKAIAKSKYEYIIEIDGDIIMDKNFIKDHLTSAKKNNFLFGSRVNIQKNHLQNLFEKAQTKFSFFSKGIKKRTRTLRIPMLANLYKEENVRSKKLRGCNMSFWKRDFVAINGFNENLVGWGIDDSEMAQRLLNNGVKGKRLKFKGLVYHIFHPEQNKQHLEINMKIEAETSLKELTFIDKGINQFL
jgi:glycosyltransferase involved in cell wall biosynthesis